MCGIAGIYNRSGFYSKEQMAEITEAMCDKLLHRGPDDAGVWVSDDERCALGHRRLSIIDLSAQSHQPMLSKSAGLTFNGEIYNYVELAQKLKVKGLACNPNSDTHTLLTGLDDMAENFISELDGMFAFAHYNQTSGQLLLARDPFGEKPLYYTDVNGCTFFASEMEAFNAIPEFIGEVTANNLSLYLYFQCPPAPYTIFANVFKLSPGAYKRFSSHTQYTETRYFVPEFGVNDLETPEHTIVEQLDDVLSESLERRLRSDVSLGAFLSGGIDSSVVVSLVTQKFGRAIDTYSVGFIGSDKSEHELAKGISSTLGSKHHSLMFDARDSVDFIDQIAACCEPNCDTSCIPSYAVAKFAGQDHKVILTGDGADEMFGGYNRYYKVMQMAESNYTQIALGAWHVGNEYTNNLNITPHHELRVLFGEFPHLLNDVLLQYRRTIDLSVKDHLSIFRQVDLSAYLPSVLAKVDRMSMAHSLETRTPFLSSDLFKFAAKVNKQHLYDGITGKNILRQLLRQYLPDSLIQKRKVGFSFTGEDNINASTYSLLLSRFHDEINSTDCFLVNMFSQQRLLTFADNLSRYNQVKQTQTVWALLLLNSFMKNYRYRIVK